MTGHSYFGNIDLAFHGNSLCDRILSDPNLWVSQYCYQQIP